MRRCDARPYDGDNYGLDEGTDTVTITVACTGFLTDCDETLDLGGGQGIDFVNITAGSFVMGSPTNELGRSSNEDQHPVTLTNDFGCRPPKSHRECTPVDGLSGI